MKKLFKITLITVGALLLLLILLPILFKGRIEEVVKQRINQEVEARVEWSGFSTSLFRGFPNLSATLHQLTVTGKNASDRDTIAALERFEMRMNPFGMFSRQIEVQSVLLYRPVIHAEIYENGEANWDILPGDQSTEEQNRDSSEGSDENSGLEESSNPIRLSLKKLVITGGEIRYLDRMNGSDYRVDELNLQMKGDLTGDQTRASLAMNLSGLDLSQNGIRYMKDGNMAMELEADADMGEKRIIINNNVLWLNGMLIEIQGTVGMPENEGVVMDLQFRTSETSFQPLLSLIPSIYMNEYESVEARGTFSLAGSIAGVLKDTLLPDVNAELKVKDGYFSYPELPRDVSDVQIDLQVDLRGEERDASTVTLHRFHMVMGGDPFDLELSVANPFSDMHVAGKALGTIDFSKIGDVFPLEEFRIGGKLETDLQWDTRMSAIEEERFEEVDLQGNLTVTGFELESSDVPVPVRIPLMEMRFTPRQVELQSMDMVLGSSELHMKGELYNFIPYLFDNQVVHGSLQVTSDYFDANEIMAAMEDSVSAKSDSLTFQSIQAPPDTLAVPGKLEIPEMIDFKLELDVDRILMDQLVLDHVEGAIRLGGGMAHIDRMTSEVLGGWINLKGSADTRGEFLKVDASVQVDGLDIPTAYEKLVSVERLVPMAGYCRGSANLDMRYSSLMDHTLTPLYGSINATGKVFTEGLQINNLQGFVNVNELVKNEKMRRLAPDEVEIEFTIRNGRVQIAPFDIDFDDSKVTVGGSHGIDHSLDYLVDMNIAKKDLGSGALMMVNNMTLMARAAGLKVIDSDYVKVKATITGTFEKPKVKTDLSGNMGGSGGSVREQLRTKAKEEIETAEQELRQEASQRAGKIIADAEAEAAKIVEEAREKGDLLVKEAELQGQKLIEEAGNQPLKKKAAERAAKEMTSQAEKQAERMIQEAEQKAAEIVTKAREEASRI